MTYIEVQFSTVVVKQVF